MVKLSTIVIGFIITMATAVLLVSVVQDFTLNYGVTSAQLMNDSRGNLKCSATSTVSEIMRLNSIFQNETVDAGTYAPGQINAPIGSNLVTSTQTAGLVTNLKLIVAPFTLTKSAISDLGCSIGVPAVLITAFQVIFITSILLLLAGIFYFRAP